MADDVPISGAGTYLQYGVETAGSYGSAAGTIDKAFGHDQRVTAWNRNHNNLRIYELGDVEAVKTAAAQFEGSITIEFILASTYFMKAVMGAVSDGGAAPYTHTYNYNTGYTITSLTIEIGLNLDTDNVYKLLGCVVNTCEIVCAVGEPIKVTLTFDYAKETLATSGFDGTPATDAEEPFMFANSSLEIPNATVVNRVQNFTLSIAREPFITRGLNDRRGTKAVWRRTRWDFRMTVAEEHDDWIEDAYGAATGPLQNTTPAGEASLELTIKNSETGSSTRSLIFLMTTTQFTSDSMTLDVASVVFHDWVGYSLAKNSIIGSDNTQNTP